MEVASFIGAAARRWWVVVVVAALAAGGAYLVTRSTKDSYDAAIVVTVPAAQSATAGSNGQYVENFSTSLTTSDVTDQISTDTHVSSATLQAGLTASQLNNSSFIEVDYNADNKATAAAVVTAAARRTSAYLARPAMQSARTEQTSAAADLAAANKDVAAAQAQLTAFHKAHGSLNPNDVLQAAISTLTQLTVSKQQAASQLRSVSGYDTAIKTAAAARDREVPLVGVYDAIVNRLHNGQLAAQTAQTRVATAADGMAAAQAAPLTGAATTTLVTGRSVVVKTVLIAAGIGAVLGIALVVIFVALGGGRSARRRRGRRVTPADSVATGVDAGTDAGIDVVTDTATGTATSAPTGSGAATSAPTGSDAAPAERPRPDGRHADDTQPDTDTLERV